MDTDIAESEKRRDEIFRTSLHEDQLEEGLSELSEEIPEEVSPTEETVVVIISFSIALHKSSVQISIFIAYLAGLGGSVGCASDWRPGGWGFNPRLGRQHSFVEIDHEIFSTVILFLPLIQEGQLSVSGERMCTILVNRLED